MTEAEKLVRRAGGRQIRATRHKVFLIGEERFTLHTGTKPNPSELKKVRKKLMRLGLL